MQSVPMQTTNAGVQVNSELLESNDIVALIMKVLHVCSLRISKNFALFHIPSIHVRKKKTEIVKEKMDIIKHRKQTVRLKS